MVVEKYAKALLLSLKEEEIVPTYEAIKKITSVVKNSKLILIIKSPLLSVEEKVKFLSQIVEYDNPKFLNFLRVILENKREDLLKEIYLNLYEKISFYFNTFNGKVEGNINEDLLKEIENELSKKFDAKIKLSLKKSDIDGIKIFVDVLNVGVVINEEKIKSNLVDYILKAI